MKKSFNRVVALLLVLTTLFSLLAATLSVGAETLPNTKTFTVDFENNVTLDANGNLGAENLVGKVASGSVTASLTNNGEGNDYLIINGKRDASGVGKLSEYQLYTADMAYENYTVSFDILFLDTPYHYMGWMIRPDVNNSANVADLYQYGEHDHDDTVAWENKLRTLLSGDKSGLRTDGKTWYTFTVTRSGTSYSFQLTQKGTVIVSGTNTNSNIAAANPLIRLMIGNYNLADTDYRFAIDNFIMTAACGDVDLEEDQTNHCVSEDFDNLTAGALGITSANTNVSNPAEIGSLNAYSTIAANTTKIAGDGDQYLEFSSASGSNGFWLYPKDFSASAYTITGDTKISGTNTSFTNGKYVGFYYVWDTATTASNSHQFLYYADKGFRVGAGENWVNPFETDKWYSFKIVYKTNKVDYYVWERDAEGGVATAKHVTVDINPLNPTHTPALRIMGGGATNATVAFDNLSFCKDSIGVDTVGAQVSAIVNDEYAVRFVGTVDSLDYSEVGFSIAATYLNGTEEVTKYFTEASSTVYTAITANDQGIKAYTAEELGGKYLIALGIHGIPASIEHIRFDVTAFYYDANNRAIPAESADCYTTVVDGAVILTDEDPMSVTPEQFGALGNGVADDTAAMVAAAAYASEKGATLLLTGNYRTNTTVAFGDLTIRSENAQITYYGKEFNRPAIDMYDNVNIYGRFTVDAVNVYNGTSDTPPYRTHGNRCGVAFGNYDSGRGAHNIYIEDIVIMGSGASGGNGMLITGGSSNITFGTVTVPEGHHNVNVPFMIHWGNYIQHHPKDFDPELEYVHEAGAGYTTHPHDITIGTIHSWADNSALYISASYNITVGEVYSYNSLNAVNIVHGDVGFLYASPEQKACGMQNIYIKKVVGTNLREWGVRLQCADGYEDDPNLNAQVKIDSIELTGAANNNGNGFCAYGVEKLEVGSLVMKGFTKQALQLGYGNKDLQFGSISVENCHAQVICTTRHATYAPNKSVSITSMSVKNSGIATSSFAVFPESNGFTLGTLTLDNVAFTNLFTVYTDTYHFRVDTINFKSVAGSHTSILRADTSQGSVTAANDISIGRVTGHGSIPLTSGTMSGVQINQG